MARIVDDVDGRAAGYVMADVLLFLLITRQITVGLAICFQSQIRYD